jgi:hypothetical protein
VLAVQERLACEQGAIGRGQRILSRLGCGTFPFETRFVVIPETTSRRKSCAWGGGVLLPSSGD